MNGAPEKVFRRRREALVGVALFLLTCGFAVWQNMRVAVLWDISFLLDTSWRWSLGQVPYRNLPFPYAPGTFLLHAAMIRVLGRVYWPHIAIAALEGGAASVLAWRVMMRSLRPLGERAWLVAGLLATPLIVLGIYGVYPHPIYDSDCVLMVLLAVWLLQRAGDGAFRNFLAGVACVVPLFVKQNIGLAFLGAILAAVVAVGIARRARGEGVRVQAWVLGGAAAALGTVLGLLQVTVGLGNYWHWTIAFAAERRLPGLGTVLEMYREGSLAGTLAAAAVAMGLLIWGRGRKWVRWAAGLLSVPFVWVWVGLVQSDDAGDRADRLLTLWPYLLVLSAVVAVWQLRPAAWRVGVPRRGLLAVVLLATVHGAFLSQQLWGSTYAIWPLLMVLVAGMLVEIPEVATAMAGVVSVTLLVCGGLYAVSHERLSYVHLEGAEARATLPALRGMTTPGEWIPEFEELVRVTDGEIPRGDEILMVPGEVPFWFATGRVPRFPVLLFDPATDPYTPEQTLEQARARGIEWVIVSRRMQLMADPHPELGEIVQVLQREYAVVREVEGYDIYRRR
jgi:hypothetical protein